MNRKEGAVVEGLVLHEVQSFTNATWPIVLILRDLDELLGLVPRNWSRIHRQLSKSVSHGLLLGVHPLTPKLSSGHLGILRIIPSLIIGSCSWLILTFKIRPKVLAERNLLSNVLHEILNGFLTLSTMHVIRANVSGVFVHTQTVNLLRHIGLTFGRRVLREIYSFLVIFIYAVILNRGLVVLKLLIFLDLIGWDSLSSVWILSRFWPRMSPWTQIKVGRDGLAYFKTKL